MKLQGDLLCLSLKGGVEIPGDRLSEKESSHSIGVYASFFSEKQNKSCLLKRFLENTDVLSALLSVLSSKA